LGNAEKFLEEFNKLEHYLEYLLDGSKASFIEKKNMLFGDRNLRYTIRRYDEDFEVINRLRNVVVHENYMDGKPLADPREDIIARVAEIFEALARPMTVFDRKSRTSPLVFSYTEPLSKALVYMSNNDFSQIVVSKQNRHFFLRREDTAKWLEEHAEGDLPPLGTVRIGDVLPAECLQKCHISKDATVYEALSYFQEYDSGYPALIITNTGMDFETPLGILTPMDLIDFVNIAGPSKF
jgi:hypothetical protein